MLGGTIALNTLIPRKRRYLGRYFAHPMMQNRRAKRNKYKPSDCPRHTALRALNRHTPTNCALT
ncbi:hypothetical protein [Piscirickettsia salmonis]|uniref:hypothetical protein n=1 Tax=Piscirickettsia salmonis TaxID=1238 RepID=UPI001C54CC50|nr:hypothetical protein [Piscirickettsia salmonis]